MRLKRADSDGLACHLETSHGSITYRSKPLVIEWRVYESLDVREHALGVIEHWNHLDGDVTRIVSDIVQVDELSKLMGLNGC